MGRSTSVTTEKKTDYDHLQEFYDKEELGTEATERCSKGKLN